MSRTKSIALLNIGSLVTTYWLVHFAPNDQEWDVRGIEIYADVGHTKLLADDIQVDDFDQIQQAALFRALNAQLDRQARIDGQMIRLAIERISMVAA